MASGRARTSEGVLEGKGRARVKLRYGGQHDKCMLAWP